PNPKAKEDFAGLEKLGIAPQSWHERKLRLVVEVDDQSILFWLEGLLAHQAPRPAGMKGPVVLQLAPGDRLHSAAVEPLSRNPLYLPIDLSSQANDRLGAAFGKTSLPVGAVPFQVATGERNLLSL